VAFVFINIDREFSASEAERLADAEIMVLVPRFIRDTLAASW
jgi:hypothetical protein